MKEKPLGNKSRLEIRCDLRIKSRKSPGVPETRATKFVGDFAAGQNRCDQRTKSPSLSLALRALHLQNATVVSLRTQTYFRRSFLSPEKEGNVIFFDARLQVYVLDVFLNNESFIA